MWTWGKALIAAAAVSAPPAPGLEEALARQERSMGAIGRVGTVTVEFSMIEPDATYELRARMQRPDRYRVDLRRFGLWAYTEAVGLRGPWQQHLLQGAPQAPSEEGARALVSGLEWFTWGRPLREIRDRGHRIDWVGAAGGEVELDVALRNGQSRRYFLDAATGRILRSRQRVALHPDQASGKAPRSLESHYEDYRAVAGVVLPFRIRVVDLETGREAQRVLVRSVRLDEPLDAALFEGR